MLIYDYNSPHHKYKEVHDETGGRIKEMTFRFYDCFCGCADYKIVSTTTRHHQNFTIVQCAKCGTLRMNPYLSDESIELYYKEIYGPIKRKDMTADALYARQSRSAVDMYESISPFVQKDSMILDYGSGAGGRMSKLYNDGYANVHIFDYDAKYMAHGVSTGLKPHAEGNRYDMVTLSHVLEHVNEPVEFLHRLQRDFIKPDGKIYIEVPMFDAHIKLIGDFHLAHKFYFTAASLTILAEIAGFTKIHEEEDAIIVTPAKTPVEVPQAEYDKALAISNALLKKAASKSKSISRKLALKELFG